MPAVVNRGAQIPCPHHPSSCVPSSVICFCCTGGVLLFFSPKLCSWCRQRVDVWDICHDCWPLRPQVTNRPIRLFEMMCLKWCNSALKLFLLRVGLDQIRQPSLISKMNIETSKKAVILWFSVTNPFTSKTVVQKNNYNYVLVTQVEKMWRLHKKVQKPQKQSPSHISGVGDTFFLSLLLLFFFSCLCLKDFSLLLSPSSRSELVLFFWFFISNSRCSCASNDCSHSDRMLSAGTLLLHLRSIFTGDQVVWSETTELWVSLATCCCLFHCQSHSGLLLFW